MVKAAVNGARDISFMICGRVGNKPIINRTRKVRRAQFSPTDILKIRYPITTNVKNATNKGYASEPVAGSAEKSIGSRINPIMKDSHNNFTARETGLDLCFLADDSDDSIVFMASL